MLATIVIITLVVLLVVYTTTGNEEGTEAVHGFLKIFLIGLFVSAVIGLIAVAVFFGESIYFLDSFNDIFTDMLNEIF